MVYSIQYKGGAPMDIDETLIECIGQDIWNEVMQTTILHATRLRQLQFSYTVLR